MEEERIDQWSNFEEEARAFLDNNETNAKILDLISRNKTRMIISLDEIRRR